MKTVLIALALVFALVFAAPASAHKDHKKKQAEAAQALQRAAQPGARIPAAAPTAVHPQGGEMMDGMDMGMERSKMTFLERLLDWFGRLHPMIVHFPIAFFPAALLTAIAGRKKPALRPPFNSSWSLERFSLRLRPQPDGLPGLARILIRSFLIIAGWASRLPLPAAVWEFGRGGGHGRTEVPE